MKNQDILCVVDFSESSLDALKWSFDLAKQTQARVIVMFCYRLIAASHDEEIIDRKRNIEAEAARKFKEFEAANLKGQSVSYKFITEIGFFHFRIEMFLRSNPVGLLVIGSSIVQNFDEYKSVGFDKFLVKAQIPVLVIPHKQDELVEL